MQLLRFQPRAIPAVATCVLLALFVHLGNWQAAKGERRAAEIAQFRDRARHGPYQLDASLLDPAQVQDAPVTVRGHYLGAEQFYLDNRLQDGKAGVHVLTPLQISGSQTRVLINRGWLPWPDRTAKLPQAKAPEGEVQVSGIASVPSGKKFFLMPEHADEREGLWSRLDMQRFAAKYPAPVESFVILQNPDDASDGLLRRWPEPEDRVAMHQSYSMQWYGMAVALVIFFCVASLRKQGSQ